MQRETNPCGLSCILDRSVLSLHEPHLLPQEWTTALQAEAAYLADSAIRPVPVPGRRRWAPQPRSPVDGSLPAAALVSGRSATGRAMIWVVLQFVV